MSAIVILVMLALNFHQLNGASMNDHLRSLNQRQRRDVSNAADAQAALDVHNRLRRQEALAATASNMEAMVWNSDVARLANNWAVQCQWSHDTSGSIGQNLYIISGTGAYLNVTVAIEAWYNEKPYYNYDTLQCQSGKVCGHYTQVVWAPSNQLGCASAFCPMVNCSATLGCPGGSGPMYNAILYVCDYTPPGNYYNTKPYTKGPVCTQCSNGKPWCSNGLCNSSCTAAGPNCTCQLSSCGNHGTLNSSSCTCSCNPGWSGSDCSACQPNSCSYHGTLDSTSCTCSCSPGWGGTDCSACQRNSNFCSIHGYLDSNSCSCSCSPGWGGSDCSVCQINSCSGHGTLNANTCACSCDSGWKGLTCNDKTGSSTPITRTSHSTTAILIFVIGFTMFVMLDDIF